MHKSFISRHAQCRGTISIPVCAMYMCGVCVGIAVTRKIPLDAAEYMRTVGGKEKLNSTDRKA